MRPNSSLYIGYWNPAITLTMLGVAAALAAGMRAWEGNIPWAWTLLVIAGLADLFDGPVARKLSLNPRQKSYGIQIDSLADAVNFGLTPCIIVLAINPHWTSLVVGLIYLVAALTRLAWFNVQAETQAVSPATYIGLPVTYAALVLPLLYLLSAWLAPTWIPVLVSVIMLILAILFVLRISIPKPTGVWYFIFPIFALITIIGLFWIPAP